MTRVPTGNSLKGKHYLAIARLVKGEKATLIARDLGIDANTIYTWQKWPLFQQRQAEYAESLVRQELDRGVEDATVLLHEQAIPIVAWMQRVILGETKLEDPKRWRMALDFLHHAGILDRQRALEAGNAAASGVNISFDQRQQSLNAGNQEIQRQLDRFNPPQSSS